MSAADRARTGVAMALLAATAASATAHPRPPDDRDHGGPRRPPPLEVVRPPPPPPPPAPPAPPRWRSLGHRMGVATFDVEHRHRMAFSYGLAGAVELDGRLRAFVDYDFLVITTGEALPDGTYEKPRGRGHSLAAGLRVPLLGAVVGGDPGVAGTRLRVYVDAKLGAAGVVTSDELLGTHAQVQGIAGLRLGMELARGGDPPRPPHTFDTHVTVSATGVPDAITWSFAIGMDWGR